MKELLKLMRSNRDSKMIWRIILGIRNSRRHLTTTTDTPRMLIIRMVSSSSSSSSRLGNLGNGEHLLLRNSQ